MAGEWRDITLGDFVSLQRGHDLTEPERRDGIVPVMGSAGQNGFHDTALAKGPGIVIGRSGASFGQVHFSEKNFWPHNTSLYVTDFKGNDPRFAFYFLKSIDFDRYNSGSAQPSLNRNFIYPIPIRTPCPEEQKAIAHILGTLDDLIELNRETNEILEAMPRALFQSWFVDFDPVRAKLEGRAPAGMDAATAALFPDHFQDSELGQIPRGWATTTVGAICDINAWSLGKNDKLETLEYVEISEVNRGDIANIATYFRGEEPSRARRRLRHGDTVLSTVRPDRGAYFLALNPPEHRVASTGFAVLTPSKAPWSFVHAVIIQPEISDHLGHLADGGAYPAVRPEIIGAIEVAIPNDSTLLDAFHFVCGPLFEMAETNRIESRDLAALRDTLLPKLLSGELSVPAALLAAEVGEVKIQAKKTKG
jgi:type I restriction enzyme S subunit